VGLAWATWVPAIESAASDAAFNMLYWGYQVPDKFVDAVQEWVPTINDLNDTPKGTTPKTQGGIWLRNGACDKDPDYMKCMGL